MKEDYLIPEGDKAGIDDFEKPIQNCLRGLLFGTNCAAQGGYSKSFIEYQVELWGKYHILVPEELNEWPPRRGMRFEKIDFWDSDRPGFPPGSLPPIPKMELPLTQKKEIGYKPFGGR